MKCFTVGDPDLKVDTTQQVHVCEAGYSHIIGHKPGPSHLKTVHNTGRSHAISYEAGRSHATSYEASSLHATSYEAGPLHVTSNEAGPSHATSYEAGPFHVRLVLHNVCNPSPDMLKESLIWVPLLKQQEAHGGI